MLVSCRYNILAGCNYITTTALNASTVAFNASTVVQCNLAANKIYRGKSRDWEGQCHATWDTIHICSPYHTYCLTIHMFSFELITTDFTDASRDFLAPLLLWSRDVGTLGHMINVALSCRLFCCFLLHFCSRTLRLWNSSKATSWHYSNAEKLVSLK